MKKLLILPLLIILSGCVSYYYPETAFEDGVYYAGDDPAYAVNQGGYLSGAYYPWYSLDYFYLGYMPYPGCVYDYGFPCAVLFGYSPWHWPYGHYGYYSPWYVTYHHYPFYPSWRPYDGFCSHHGGCGRRNAAGNRFAGTGNRHAKYDNDIAPGDENAVTDDNEQPARHAGTRNNNGGFSSSPFSRYVSTVPAGHSGDRGMVIRSNQSRKIGKSRLEPGKSAPVTATSGVNVRPQTAPASSSFPRSSTAPISRAPSRSTRSRSGFSSPGRSRSGSKSPTRDDHN